MMLRKSLEKYCENFFENVVKNFGKVFSVGWRAMFFSRQIWRALTNSRQVEWGRFYLARIDRNVFDFGADVGAWMKKLEKLFTFEEGTSRPHPPTSPHTDIHSGISNGYA